MLLVNRYDDRSYVIDELLQNAEDALARRVGWRSGHLEPLCERREQPSAECAVSGKPLAIDLFAGAGGMSLGFEDAGFRVIGAVEVDPVHLATYQHNFANVSVVEQDVSLVSGEDLHDWFVEDGQVVDVLFGGPPCQGFSYIGRNRPDDPRNDLLLQFARVAAELRPRFFVVENVEGLLAKKHDETLHTFMTTVNKAGYKVISELWLLDAQVFGVPQRRRRVFLVGALEGLKLPCRPKEAKSRPTVWDAIADLMAVDEAPEMLCGDVYHGDLGEASEYAASLRCHGAGRIDGKKAATKLTGCRRSAHTEPILQRFARTSEGEYEAVSRFYRLARHAVGPTLRAGTDRHNGSYTAARPIHPIADRCITVREAARLHSFPDSFQFHATVWHGFRQIGNAVPPLLAQAVGTSVLELC